MRAIHTSSVPPQRVFIVLAVAVLAVSAAGTLVRGVGDVPALSIALWRTAMVACALAPFASKMSRRDASLTLLSGALLAGHFVAWFTAIQSTTIMRSTVLVCTAPMWTGGLEWVLFREKPKNRYWIGLLFATAGIAWMSTFDGEAASLKGDLLAVLGGFLGALYLLVGRSVRQRVNIQSYACWVCASAAIWLLPIVLFTGTPTWGFSLQSWVFILALAAGPQMLGHNGFNYALQYIKASTVSTLMLLEPAGATLLAWLAFGEMPSLQEVTGGLAAVIGVLVATWTPRAR